MSSRKKKTGSTNIPEGMEACADLLRVLSDKPEADPFLEPVDWERFNLLDYPKIIKTPMDLGTIQQNLEAGKYTDINAFAVDVRLVWRNAMKYNVEGSQIYETSEKLSKFFEKKFVKVASKKNSSKRKRSADNSGAAPVSRQDRLNFSKEVNKLNSNQLSELVDRIENKCPKALNEENDDEIEIEINNIDSQTLLELNKFVQECISSTTKGRRKV